MTLGFVPLVPGVLAKGSKSRTAPAPSDAFESAESRLNSPVPEPHVHKDSTITVERQGDTITHIRVQCGCGHVTELKCEY